MIRAPKPKRIKFEHSGEKYIYTPEGTDQIKGQK